MSQVTIYLPDALERELRSAARKAGKSFSAYIVDLATRKKSGKGKGWSREFLATFGGWKGPFEEPPEFRLEKRDEL